MKEYPVLYSYRRCPYAMRARIALRYAGVQYEHREIVLRNKPVEMLKISPKGTVPVLQTAEMVIEESLDIMTWACRQKDEDKWLDYLAKEQAIAEDLIKKNDENFKFHLDRYKYPERYNLPHHEMLRHREEAAYFLSLLNERLSKTKFLISHNPQYLDVAIFPFVRQFSKIDNDYYLSLNYPYVKKWLNHMLTLPWYVAAMERFQPWKAGATPIIIP